MHEVSLCENIRELLEVEAREQLFTRVRQVWLDVGAFSCVEPDALRFAFDAVMQGSVAEGAALEIGSVGGRATCLNCGAAAEVTGRFDPCPACGQAALHVAGGDDLRIRKVEVV